jgi:hypothetical protein
VRLLVLAFPTELAAGRYPAPAWAILAVAGAVIAGAALYLGVRRSMGGAETPPKPPEDSARTEGSVRKPGVGGKASPPSTPGEER